MADDQRVVSILNSEVGLLKHSIRRMKAVSLLCMGILTVVVLTGAGPSEPKSLRERIEALESHFIRQPDGSTNFVIDDGTISLKGGDIELRGGDVRLLEEANIEMWKGGRVKFVRQDAGGDEERYYLQTTDNRLILGYTNSSGEDDGVQAWRKR